MRTVTAGGQRGEVVPQAMRQASQAETLRFRAVSPEGAMEETPQPLPTRRQQAQDRAVANAVAVGGSAEQEISGSGHRECNVERCYADRRIGSSAVDRRRIERSGAVDRYELLVVKRPVGRRSPAGPATTNAIAQGGGAGQARTRARRLTPLGRPPRQGVRRDADRWRGHVADTLLGPREMVFGTAIRSRITPTMAAARATFIARPRRSIFATGRRAARFRSTIG